MKRVFIAIFFLILSVSLCVFEQYMVATTYKQATSYIDSAISDIQNNDYASAESTCKELDYYWHKRLPVMTAMIEHGPLDEAGITIGALTDMFETRSDSIEDELIEVKNQIKSIRDNQRITFGNVF